MMVVLSGTKTVELWPPGEASLLRAAGVPWRHHVESLHHKHQEEIHEESHGNKAAVIAAAAAARPSEVFVLNAGDVAFWPEGWWHRVSSAPATRAGDLSSATRNCRWHTSAVSALLFSSSLCCTYSMPRFHTKR